MSLRYLSTAEAAKVVGISKTTMGLYIAEPDGPPTYDIGRNGRPRIRIREDELHEWMKSRERAS